MFNTVVLLKVLETNVETPTLQAEKTKTSIATSTSLIFIASSKTKSTHAFGMETNTIMVIAASKTCATCAMGKDRLQSRQATAPHALMQKLAQQ
jgi:hypothetical protein